MEQERPTKAAAAGLNVEAAIVNYGTPDLTRAAVWSLRTCYPALPIHVVDSHSPDDSVARLTALGEHVQPFTLTPCRTNVHHGPGLDLALRTARAEWILIFDSDCIAFRTGFLEQMLDHAQDPAAYMIGALYLLDEDGYAVQSAEAAASPYVHPFCALVRRARYLTLPPFEKHGVPCLKNERAALQSGYKLVDFPVKEYVYHLGRGTASKYGYSLGLRGQALKVKRWLKARAGRLKPHNPSNP
jgi:hypothetical protein